MHHVLTEDYRVRLDAFEGPLDLLLYLIRKNEVEIDDIPIAEITRQYLTFLGEVERIDIDEAGEFLVMAATLMEIKSRMLMPAPPPAEGQSERPDRAPEDPRADLVRQLLAFKAFRDASAALQDRFDTWQARFPAAPAVAPDVPPADPSAAEEPASIDIDDLAMIDLVRAFQGIMESVNFDRLGEHEVKYDDTPVELHAEDLADFLRRDADTAGGTYAGTELTRIFAGRTRPDMVGLFLALLQLVKNGRVRVAQDPDGRVVVAPREDPPESPATESAT